MIQTTFCIPLEARPESAERLCALIETVKEREDQGPVETVDNFARLTEGLPDLHFMSMSVFFDSNYDPTFVIELNFDGPPGPFWPKLEALMGPDLRAMVACCKRPLDKDGPLYDQVTAPESRVPVTGYLAARVQGPSVFHHGNRGLSRDRIVKEAALFRAIRTELDAPEHQGIEPYRGADMRIIHDRLRQKMLGQHSWLSGQAVPRVPAMQRVLDIARLLLFVSLVILVMSVPGIALASHMQAASYIALVAVLAVILSFGIWKALAALPGTEVKTEFSLTAFLKRSLRTLAVFVLPPLVTVVLLGLGLVWLLYLIGFVDTPPAQWVWPVTRTMLLGLLGMAVTVPTIILWLRYLERRDTSHDAPQIDAHEVAQMARREDWISQNHMGSIVNIRPGILRTAILKLVHRALGLLLRVKATNGYLGSMRTVHFAHWAFLNNDSQLLFLSNFDQSWGSYLDDFIEKAHVGLTLAWGCGVGFPPTRYLIFDGASHGRRFKNWALASRSVSRFWYSAYPDLSVDQIERNHRVAEGLRARHLSDTELRHWLRDL